MDENLQSLLLAAREGSLSAARRRELNALLRADPAARRAAARWLSDDAALREELRVSTVGGIFDAPARRRVGARPLRRPLALAAAAMVTLAAGVLGWLTLQPPRTILTVESVVGSLDWSDGQGGDRLALAPGARLPAGMLALDGQGAAATLRFKDGSRIFLSSGTELVVSERDGKRIRLRRGDLAADVEPQPVGRPMILRTPNSEARVLGTRFQLSAMENTTVLEVDEGLVELERRTDGQTTRVAAAERLAVRNADESALSPATISSGATRWQAAAPFAAESIREGTPSPRGLATAPCLDRVNREADLEVFHRAALAPGWLEAPEVAPSSMLRVRFSTIDPGPLALWVQTRTADSRFTGNFQIRLRADDLAPLADGSFEITVPLAGFDRTGPGEGAARPGDKICRAWVTTHRQDLGLTLHEIEIFQP